MSGGCHHCGWNRRTCQKHGPADPIRDFRALSPEEESEVPVRCSHCARESSFADRAHECPALGGWVE